MSQSVKMKRRHFNQSLTLSAAALLLPKVVQAASANPVRLGGPVFGKLDNPEAWVAALKSEGYSAAYCPVGPDADESVIKQYEGAARKADIIIAEVGAWSNPISPDEKQRKEALKKCIDALNLAEKIGANCCVNISGSRNAENWAGHHADNLTAPTFDLIVETTRKIIDAVNPRRTFFTLETMQWAYPDSVESYQKLFKAIDRKAFAVHLDPTNLICSPQRYHNTASIIRDAFKKLGKHIKSCHAKDISLSQKATVHLDEVVPGTGNLDYTAYLKELSKLKDIPLMMEHMKQDEYPVAAQNIRKIGKACGVEFQVLEKM